MCSYGKLRIYCNGETREAAGLARQSETRVATTSPTRMSSQSQVGLRCIYLRLHASLAQEKHPSREIRTDRHLRMRFTQVSSPSSRSSSSCPHPAKI